jgi:hypothetical protein
MACGAVSRARRRLPAVLASSLLGRTGLAAASECLHGEPSAINVNKHGPRRADEQDGRRAPTQQQWWACGTCRAWAMSTGVTGFV